MSNAAECPRKLRILFADDNRPLQRVVRRTAEGRGHETIPVLAGADILASAVAAQPDAIVLDMVFPDADGRDILAELKSNPTTARIPVIVWSGHDRDGTDSKAAIQAGADDYMLKCPVDYLLDRVERVAMGLSSQPAPAFGKSLNPRR